MATDDGSASEPLQGLPVVGRKGGAQDTTTATVSTSVYLDTLPADPNGHSHSLSVLSSGDPKASTPKSGEVSPTWEQPTSGKELLEAAVTGAPDHTLRPVEDSHGSVSPHSNGVLRQASKVFNATEVTRAADPTRAGTPCEASLPGDCRDATCVASSVCEGGTVLPSVDAVNVNSAVPNGDISVRCIRERGGTNGRILPDCRRRSASDGAVLEDGWARRGRSSHSECNGLDQRVTVLGSSGSSSGSTEGPDSPLPGEELGSGVRWTGGGRSVSEVKELAYARLQAELSRAQQELRLRDEEVARLSQIRDQVGAELEELTASLFEEANNMVREANMKQAAAEKRLQEATLKVEVLQAEVSALKALVLTSTPSRPNAHLHPQLSRHRHRRSPSNYELATCRPPSPPQAPQQQQQPEGQAQPGCDGAGPDLSEVDPVCHREFVRWQECPRVDDQEDQFVARLYREDVLPCLHFPNSQLAAQVLRAIEENSITIEAVTAANPFPRRCSLLEAPRVCQYRMRLGESGASWHHISQLCRNRITSVCELFCYLRYIQQGLVRSTLQEMYWEVMRRRRSVALARLGLPSC